MVRFVLACSLLSFISIDARAQDNCGLVGAEQLYGESKYLIEDYTATIAWKKDGKDGKDLFLLNDQCNTLYVGKRRKLYFLINNWFDARESDGTSSFISVQIAKLQSLKQTNEEALDIIVERNNNKWTREDIPQLGITAKEIHGLKADEFNKIHSTTPFNDSKLKFREYWWHARPEGGIFTSYYAPEKWRWDLDILRDFPDRVWLSNRLYRFDFNPNGNSGVPFDVGITRATELYIKIFSPIWPGQVIGHRLLIVRK